MQKGGLFGSITSDLGKIGGDVGKSVDDAVQREPARLIGGASRI